ncbi:hypothetical protein KQX54_010558 [Cotesia glomerata]|uniref:Uncharacterized protein n=2 Tax=Cotesia glomerata TaxID=32391 RepID=A0AAV7HQT5_COTGL|nr:hypothetical protein KQX54_010558 [Cotesia glomerata]
MYHLKEDGKLVKCGILSIAASRTILQNPNTRLRRPKYNESSLESSTEENNELPLHATQQKRKNIKLNANCAKKTMSKDILNAYKAKRKEEIMKKKGAKKIIKYKPDGDKTPRNNEVDSGPVGEFENNAAMAIEEHNKIMKVVEEDSIVHEEEKSDRTVESEEEEEEEEEYVVKEEIFELGSDADVDDNEQPEYVTSEIAEVNDGAIYKNNIDNDENNYNSNNQIESNNDRANAMVEKKSKESRQQDAEMKRLRRQLKEQNNTTSQQQQQQQRQQQQQLQLREQLQEEERQREERQREERQREEHQREERQREEQQRGDRNGQIIDPVCIGNNILVPGLTYHEAFGAYTPAKFITIMSHAIWGHEELALRAVARRKTNQYKILLSSTKKLVLLQNYQKLKKKRNLSQDLINVETTRFLTYLGRAITSAERKKSNQNINTTR